MNNTFETYGQRQVDPGGKRPLTVGSGGTEILFEQVPI